MSIQGRIISYPSICFVHRNNSKTKSKYFSKAENFNDTRKQPVKAIRQFVFQGWYFKSLTIRVSKAWSANVLSFTLSRYHYDFKDISEGDDWLVGWCGLNGPLRRYFSRFSETIMTVSAISPECPLKWPFIIVTFILEMGI